MKRIITILLALAMLFSLSAYGKGGNAEYIQSNSGAYIGSPIMKGDGGYYYNVSSLNKLALRYYDIETGKTIFLCSKPECAHDGNIYCTATSEKYRALGTAYYENELYIAALEATDSEIMYKLLRASKNGTELTEISTFAKMSTDDPFISQSSFTGLVIHKGKAYFPYTFAGNESVSLDGIAEIDIATGRSRSIIEGTEHGQFFNMTAAGDTVYFMSLSTNFNFNIFAYDINGKLTENIVTIEDGWLYSGTVVGEKFWYTMQTKDFDYRIMIYDPQTKESTEFAFDEDIEPVGITTDGEYLYIADEKINHVSDENVRVAVCTLDGKKLAGFEIPISDSAQGVGEEYALNVLDDMVYIQYYDKVVCCPLEDILDGNTTWKELFCFERREVY